MALRRCIGPAYRDDLESADLLMHAGAKVNAANDLGATPLWPASQNGSRGHGQAASGRRARIRTLALLAGETPLMVAAAFGLSRRRRTTARQGRESECARLARTDGADVGCVAEASGCR